MNSWSPSPKPTRADVLAVLVRWALGAFFVYMGMSKALHPEAFLKLVRQYEVVSNPFFLNAIAASLPWFEVFCGLLLVAGVAVRGAALMLVLMLIPFTVVVVKRALAIATAQGVAFWAVKFDCGCGTGEVIIWQKVLENTLFVLLACWLLTGRGWPLSARFSLFTSDGPDCENREDVPELDASDKVENEFSSSPPSPEGRGRSAASRSAKPKSL